MNSGRLARILGALLLGVTGFQLGDLLGTLLGVSNRVELLLTLALAAAFGAFGLLFAPQLTIVPFNRARRRLASMAVGDLVAVGVGAVLGLLVSALLTFPLGALPGLLGDFAPGIAAVGICYTSVTILLARHRELAEYVTERKFLSGAPRKGVAPEEPAQKYLLDTSAIIDGRIADVSETGFLTGVLLVPQFVLRELQNIADSGDALRRNRGRRGLDVLARLQGATPTPLEVVDLSSDVHPDVDSKLVGIAREHGYPIITNDYNLNKVAALQGVKILNINELAQAVKPLLLPGEDVSVRIIQEGKELNQGVGYLDDGTMVVVENGRRVLNAEVDVTVTRVLQTMAGRMIFAQISADNHRH